MDCLRRLLEGDLMDDKDSRVLSMIKPLLFATILILYLADAGLAHAEKRLEVYFFWGDGCPHCEKEKIFLDNLKRNNPDLEIRSFEVWHNQENSRLFSMMLLPHGTSSGAVPAIFIGNSEPVVGYQSDELTGAEIERKINYCLINKCASPLSGSDRSAEIGDTATSSSEIDIPLIGKIDARSMALPALTVVLGGLDGFNPCAFYVLFLLLSMLVYAQSRTRMLLIGGTFVFFSGFIYFLFMAAWLNVFLIAGKLAVITTIAGALAVVIAAINIKDYFYFKKGVSLSIPDSAKPKLHRRMRNLLKASSTTSMLAGTIVLAIAANSYELLCTMGFPLVFTKILTLNKLPHAQYYLYLVLYNVIYVMPLSLIVVVFVVTLGTRKLTERQGQVLKLVSGFMMLYLGGVLLLKPALLNNVFIAIGLMAAALSTTFIIVQLTKKLRQVP